MGGGRRATVRVPIRTALHRPTSTRGFTASSSTFSLHVSACVGMHAGIMVGRFSSDYLQILDSHANYMSTLSSASS
jgi:hypothetical protein